MVKTIYFQLLLVLLLVGCTNNNTADTGVDTLPPSETISKFTAEIKETNERPYFKGDTYYTINEEVTLMSHEFITDSEGKPTLVLWVNYTNIGDDAFAPIGVRGHFNFFQNGEEIEEGFASISEEFSEENPHYEEAYGVAIHPIAPGEKAKIYIAIPLGEKSDVRLEFDEKIINDDNESILFSFNEE